MSEKRSEAEREGRKRERLEKESRDLRAQVEAKNTEVPGDDRKGSNHCRPVLYWAWAAQPQLASIP